MVKKSILLLIFFSCLFASEFLVEKKNNSVKELQEKLCTSRVNIMRLINDLHFQTGMIQQQLQEDFFAFATGDKKSLLLSKNKDILEKKLQQSLQCEDTLKTLQKNLLLFFE